MNNNGHIVFILPRGEAIRNFVYTGTLDYLAENTRLTVFSVFPSQEIKRLLEQQFEEVSELKAGTEHLAVTTIRYLLMHAHDRVFWTRAAREHWRRQEINRRSERFTKFISRFFASQGGVKFLAHVERQLSWMFRTPETENYATLFRQLKPTLVFNASHIHSSEAIQAVDAAQKLGISTATFVFSWDNLTSRSRIIPSYDYYLVWNQKLRAQLLKMYPDISSDRVFVTGTPQFDFHFDPEFYWSRDEYCKKTGLVSARPIVLYSTGIPKKMPGELKIIEGIADILAEMEEFNFPQLVVRIYAKGLADIADELSALKERRPDIRFLDIPWIQAYSTPLPEDSFLLVNSLRHADVGINVASTISLELCMFGKPVINVGYNPPDTEVGLYDYSMWYEYDHYKPLATSGAVHVANSKEQMWKLLKGALNDPIEFSSRGKSFVGQFFDERLDGCARYRVASCLLTLENQIGSETP